ncbi:hypothetical protein GCM10010252_58960 [Streptomyces aureoverticillatus]|nr:hypothetical protein GCM10010252_58960 [Streptomyces aureoverticillatus]
MEADDLVAVVDDGTVDDRTDDGVQAGAVAPGSQDTNAHSPEYLRYVDRIPDHVVRLDQQSPYRREVRLRRVRPPTGHRLGAGWNPARPVPEDAW